jgi:LmbE family N-acetylglucosaminyl deacetylase
MIDVVDSCHRSALIVVAHPDDEVLGCGGTISALSTLGFDVHIIIAADGVFGRTRDERKRECRRSAATRAGHILGATSVMFLDFADQMLDSIPLLTLIKRIEDTMQHLEPTMVVTHSDSDLNKDHRIVFEATSTAFRPQPSNTCLQFLCMEIQSTTEFGGMFGTPRFLPNTFVDISRHWEVKLSALREYDEEMRDYPHPRSYQYLDFSSRFRGAAVGCARAEAFQCLYEVKRF